MGTVPAGGTTAGMSYLAIGPRRPSVTPIRATNGLIAGDNLWPSHNRWTMRSQKGCLTLVEQEGSYRQRIPPGAQAPRTAPAPRRAPRVVRRSGWCPPWQKRRRRRRVAPSQKRSPAEHFTPPVLPPVRSSSASRCLPPASPVVPLSAQLRHPFLLHTNRPRLDVFV